MSEGIVIGLGMFDGVHIAHQALINQVLSVGRTFGVRPCIHLFRNHPLSVLKGNHPGLLTTLEEKIGILKTMGVERYAYEDFTPEFAGQTPEEFADYLAHDLKAKYVVAGFNYSFAKGGQGDSVLLGSLCNERGIGLYVVPPVKVGDTLVSSTTVRELIRDGKIQQANALLGYEYFCTGKVTGGRGVGRCMGYPTANLAVHEDKVLPPNGVYLTRLTVGGETLNAITNVGVRPTFGESEQVTVETFIPGFQGQLYGEEAKLSFVTFVRGEQHFDSAEALSQQIAADVFLASHYFENEQRK